MTPEMTLKIQYCVAGLYGDNRVKTLQDLMDPQNEVICGQDPVKHAISYNIYYGDPEAKQIALDLAHKMKILTPEEIERANA